MEPNEFAHVPDNVRSLIEHVGIVNTEEMEPDLRALIERFSNGDCMTCGAELGSTTVVIVNAKGITAMYCSGPCLQDMGVLGWLEEHYQDVLDGVKFRGGSGDEPEPS